MVGAVNAKTTDDFDKFKTAAKAATSNVTPAGGVFGGSVAKASSSSGSGSSSGGSSTLVPVASGTGTGSGAHSTASGSPVSGAGAVGVSFGVLAAALGFALA